MQYRKKPVVVEAIQLPAAGEDVPVEFHEWCERVEFHDFTCGRDETLVISTLEGAMVASPGDWIIKGVKGEFYPCRPDIFAMTYEAATETTPQPTESAEPVAWLHDVVAGDGEPDQALSFSGDSFPLEGVGGFRSLKSHPLHLKPRRARMLTDEELRDATVNVRPHTAENLYDAAIREFARVNGIEVRDE